MPPSAPFPDFPPDDPPDVFPNALPAYTIDQIVQNRDARGTVFQPYFTSMNQAMTSYPNWLAIGNVPVPPEANDRQQNDFSQDDTDLVRRLFEAFRNTENTYEEPSNQGASGSPQEEGQQGQQGAGRTFSKPMLKVVHDIPDLDVQLLCWRLLSCIYKSQAGVNSLPLTYTVKARGYGEFNTFMERFNEVEESLRSSKLLCKDILNGDEHMFRLAWNPSIELRRKNHNKTGNARRNVQNRTGALAINKGIISVENGKVIANAIAGTSELGQLALPRHSKSLTEAMEKIPVRNSAAEVTQCQEQMGIKRKGGSSLSQTQRRSKRARPAAQAPDAPAPDAQASGVQAPDAQTPLAQPHAQEDTQPLELSELPEDPEFSEFDFDLALQQLQQQQGDQQLQQQGGQQFPQQQGQQFQQQQGQQFPQQQVQQFQQQHGGQQFPQQHGHYGHTMGIQANQFPGQYNGNNPFSSAGNGFVPAQIPPAGAHAPDPNAWGMNSDSDFNNLFPLLAFNQGRIPQNEAGTAGTASSSAAAAQPTPNQPPPDPAADYVKKVFDFAENFN